MKILVIGGTGMVGSRVFAEATSRGHDATAVARSTQRGDDAGPGGDESRGSATVGSVTSADATDPAAIAPLIAAHHVSVLTTRPAPGQKGSESLTTSVVLDAALVTGRPVLVIGGAGPLLSPDREGVRVLDDERYVPEAWRDIAQASAEQLVVCAGHQARWSYLSPPAILTPGERTGRYRRGGEVLVVDADGRSWISVEDLAVAVIDDLENGMSRGHWSVGY